MCGAPTPRRIPPRHFLTAWQRTERADCRPNGVRPRPSAAWPYTFGGGFAALGAPPFLSLLRFARPAGKGPLVRPAATGENVRHGQRIFVATRCLLRPDLTEWQFRVMIS